MRAVKKNTPEVAPDSILEEDFKNIFLSTYRLQFVMGSCRVSIKNNIVTPPTLPQKLYTLLCISITLGLSYVTIPVFLKMMPVQSLVTLGMAVIISIFSASFINVLHVRFANGRRNALFLKKMQKLDRLMKIEKRKALNHILKMTNILSGVMILIALVSLMVMSMVLEQWEGFAFIGMAVYLLNFILELIVCSSLVVFFFIRVRFVNFMIESYLKLDENVRKPTILGGASIKWIRFVAEDTNNFFTTSDIQNYLKEIFRCFGMFQDLYRFQLLLFCIKLVVISLMSFEMLLYTLSQNIYGAGQISILVVFIVIDSFIAAFLAFRFGIFFSEVKETKRLCIAVMAIHHEGPLRDKAKVMLDLIEETPPKFSIYDMWDMNAGSFVTIFSLITSLIVTLIQFAFL